MLTKYVFINKSLLFSLWLLLMMPKGLLALQLDDYTVLLPKGTNVSMLVQTVDDKKSILVDHQSDLFKTPASTQKIITALAARLALGEDFRFITKIQTDGSIKNKVLNGNLIIQMSGDPTFTHEQLREMLSVLKLKGINKITGNIILDTSIFASHDKAIGWAWDNLTACYNTPPSATIIDGNCFYVGIMPANQIGQQADISVSPIYPVFVSGNVKTIKNDSDILDDKFCELDMVYLEKNHYQLDGCIPFSKNKSYFKFAVLDGVNYFSSILKRELINQKITLSGNIIESKQTNKKTLTPLAINQSPPLSDLLSEMLKNSNNLYADAIFRTVGAHYHKTAGTWRNASIAVEEILFNYANIDLENSVIVDGSGLSRRNLISAEKMMEILQYIAAHNETLHLIEMLPIAGVDGTLQYRRSMNKSPFKTIVFAKTGYLEGNYNLAGYIKTGEDKYVAFVQFISGYHYLTNNNKEKKNSAIMQFEEALYKAFIDAQSQ